MLIRCHPKAIPHSLLSHSKMAPTAPRAETPADIQNRRDDIVRRLQHGLDVQAGLQDARYFVFQMAAHTTIRRSDLQYAENTLLPTLRQRLSFNGVPLVDRNDVQVIGQIEIEGDCECEHCPCRCAIRRTLKVTLKPIRRPPQNQNQNQNANGNQ